MPSVKRIWNFHETKTVYGILEQKQVRDRQLIDIFQEIRAELPKKAENRMLDSLISRVEKLEAEEVESYNALQRIIEKHENTLCGALTVSAVKGFGFCLFVMGVAGAVVSAIELILEKLVEQREGTQDIITTIFNVSVLFFTVMGTCGLCLQYFGQKAINKATKYRDLTWQERKEIKVLLKYFREMRSLQTIKHKKKIAQEEQWTLIEEKFQKLLQQSREIPTQFESVTLFRNREELTNYLLLSLPKDHPIRAKINTLERFGRDGSLPADTSSSSVPEDASTNSEPGTQELTESDIDIVPDEERDFFVHHCRKKIRRGQTFEKGVLKGIKAEHLEDDEVNERIKRKQALCDTWLQIEQYAGAHNLRQGFTKIRVGDVKIHRSKVFREMPHDAYKRKSSLYSSDHTEGMPPSKKPSSPKPQWLTPAHWLKSPF